VCLLVLVCVFWCVSFGFGGFGGFGVCLLVLVGSVALVCDLRHASRRCSHVNLLPESLRNIGVDLCVLNALLYVKGGLFRPYL
jgi:hypothetical protein